MKSSIIAFTTTLLALTTAAPTPAAENDKRWIVTNGWITPTYNSLYNRNTGGLTYNPATLSSIFDKTTTISAFNIPSTLSGSKCRLGFYIDPADTTATLTAATGVQIFSSLQVPPTYDVPSWGPPGNQRDQHYGNLKLSKPGEATVDDWPRLLAEFPCKTGLVSFEVAAKWDVGVTWDPKLSGLYVAKV